MVEPPAHNRSVLGSSPSGSTIKIKLLQIFTVRAFLWSGVLSHARRASSCTPSKAPAGLREVFCPELVIFPKTGVQIGNTGGFLLPSTSGRGGHKKRWPVPEPLQLFRESLPLPCFPCASFLFKSGLYSPSIAGSASKAAPCLPSRWPFRHAPRCGVERSEYSERESLSWGPARGEVPFSY